MSIDRISKWLLPLAILAYALFNAQELFKAWMHAPLDWLGWLPFLIWLAPLLFVSRGRAEPLFLWVAVAATLLGNLVSVNALKYLGFSAAVAAWAPLSWSAAAWWICSIAWMPAFGWLGSRYFPSVLLIGRLLLAGGAAACLVIFNPKRLD